MYRVLTHSEMRDQLAALKTAREGCPACNGDAELCRGGLPNGYRHPKCQAFTDTGMVAAQVREIRQPWDVNAA